MMRIHPKHIQAVCKAKNAQDLRPFLQQAIELEHATIPPYLCAYFSLRDGANAEAASIIRSVVVEEMLHMTIASNVLLAIGGSPVINRADFVPNYPGGLPFGIGGAGFEIPLKAASIAQVRDVFMKIEEPEEPLGDVAALSEAIAAGETPDDPSFATIGAFYTFLQHKICALWDKIHDPSSLDRQVVARQWFPDTDELFRIDSADAAWKALEVIIDQGEGAKGGQDPIDDQGIPAHYYRFKEIVEGHRLIQKGDDWVFEGAPVAFDASAVWAMAPNPRVADYAQGSRSRLLAQQFNYSYTMLLNALHDAFNGNPSRIDAAMGVMYELRFLAQQVLATPAAWADPTAGGPYQTGLTFEYQPLNP